MATKVTTKSGKVRYLSHVIADRARAKARRAEAEIDWATYKPKHRKFGVFANVATNRHTHNGEIKYL